MSNASALASSKPPTSRKPTRGTRRFAWRHPARTMVAVVIAYLLSNAVHLPEPYWAALSAVIVTRPQSGAALQAGADRLVGTLLGGGFAVAAAASTRYWHLNDLLVLCCALVPLALISAWRNGYRTAPVAAIIVLSATHGGHGAAGVALLRMIEITVGGVVGIAVSSLLLPSRAPSSAGKLAGAALASSLMVLDAAFMDDAERCGGAQRSSREWLRKLTVVQQAARWEWLSRRDKTAIDTLLTNVAQLDVAVNYAVRLMFSAHQCEPKVALDRALRGRIRDIRLSAQPILPAAAKTSAVAHGTAAPTTPLSKSVGQSPAPALSHAFDAIQADVDAIVRSLTQDAASALRPSE
ncbi:MAG: FUSC family protein [Janthinobacterium lividum]